MQPGDDVAKHGNPLVAVHLCFPSDHLGPRLGFLLDGRGQVAQKCVDVHARDTRGRPQGGHPSNGGAGDLVLQHAEVRVVRGEEVLEEGMGGKQVVNLGVG